MINIGLQLYSLQMSVDDDLMVLLDDVSEMGYGYVQFAGFFDYSAKEVKEKLLETGLQAFGAHVALEELETNLRSVLSYHDEIGNKLLIVPFIDPIRRQNSEDYVQLGQILNQIGKEMKNKGFQLAYHNHDFEFDLFDGKTGFDILFGETDEDYVKIELDSYWVAYKGYDPVEVMMKYPNRVVSLHMKDMTSDVAPISTEINQGVLPLLDYMKQGMIQGVKGYIVEQEHFSSNPKKSVMMSLEAMNMLKDKLMKK